MAITRTYGHGLAQRPARPPRRSRHVEIGVGNASHSTSASTGIARPPTADGRSVTTPRRFFLGVIAAIAGRSRRSAVGPMATRATRTGRPARSRSRCRCRRHRGVSTADKTTRVV
eukprot:4849986-Prymnesium_polylepis.2